MINDNPVSIFIYPTDTVWGMGSSIFDEQSNIKIAHIKKTSPDKPLTILFTSIEQLFFFIDIKNIMQKVDLEKLFELEITIGIPVSFIKNNAIPEYLMAKSDDIYFRCLPQLKGTFVDPITTTSVNTTGENPLNDINKIKHFLQESNEVYPECNFKIIELECMVLSGNSSTIVTWKDGTPVVIREGKYVQQIKDKLTIFST